MKLQHKIAGTILLPLAAAAMSTSAHAELSVGGYVAAQFAMVDDSGADQKDMAGNAATSRLSIKQTNVGNSNATVLVEGDFWGGRNANRTSNTGKLRLRHAVVFVDGFAVGQTWSPSANLNALLPTIDFVGYTAASAPAGRTPQITKIIDMGGSTFKIGIEDNGKASAQKDGTSIPDLSAGFTMNTGSMSVFAGASMINANDLVENEVTQVIEATASVKMDMGGMKVVGSFGMNGDDDTNVAEYTAFSLGVSAPLGGGLSANAMAEVKQPGSSSLEDQTTVFANVFYKMPSGLEFGAEVQNVTNLSYADGSDLTNINFQGKFAF